MMLRPEYYGPRSFPLENATVGAFVSNEIWGEPDRIAEYCSMGVFDGEELVAGTLYHNWHEDSGVIELTSASKSRRWLTRPIINAMFRLPFDILGCQMVALRVSEKNEPMIRIARSFGFNEAFIPRLRGRNEGEMIFTYSDDQWRASPYHREVKHQPISSEA